MKKKNTFASYKHQRPLSDCIDRFISFSHLRLSLIFSWGGEPTTIPTNRSNCMRFVSENAGYACSLNTLSKYASLQFSPSLQKTSSTTEMFFLNCDQNLKLYKNLFPHLTCSISCVDSYSRNQDGIILSTSTVQMKPA